MTARPPPSNVPFAPKRRCWLSVLTSHIAWAAPLLLLSWAANADMQSLKRGLFAYERADYESALDEWLPLAREAFAPAPYYVAMMYERGLGVPQDLDAALRWYQRAEDLGMQVARSAVARLESGVAGRFIDAAAKALDAYRGAHLGDKTSQFELAQMYLNPDFFPEDRARAVHWLRQASWQGHVEARLLLAEHYALGMGVEQDLGQAMHWWGVVAHTSERHRAEAESRMREVAQSLVRFSVDGSSVNLRSAPSTDSRVLLRLPRSAEVLASSGPSGEWYRVYSPDHVRSGYISKPLLARSPNQRGVMGEHFAMHSTQVDR